MYNIERQTTGKGMKHPENSGEPTKKKTCPLCLQIGLHQFVCKVFEHKYHIKSLPKNNDEARAMLANILPALYGSLTFNRRVDDNRKILKDFSEQKATLGIHKMYHINHDITLVGYTDNICIGYTLISEVCIKHNLYRRVFFLQRY